MNESQAERSSASKNASSSPGWGNSDWQRLAGGVLGVLIVLATVLGSFILSTQEALPPTQLATPSPVPSVAVVTPPPITSVLPSSTPEPSAAPSATPTVTCSIPLGWAAYTVKAGDTLSSLASTAGTSTFVLIQGNCLGETDLIAGQLVYLPPPPTQGPTPVPTRCSGPPANWVKYVVLRGDTLYGLSVRYQTTVNALAAANCLDTSDLRAGQVLYVPPVSFATPTPLVPTPTPSPQPSDTPTPTDTPAPILTETVTPASVTATFTPGPSKTPTPAVSPSWTPQPTDTLLPSDTPSTTPSSTPQPSDTPGVQPSSTPQPSDTPVPSATP
ncbi:MAG: LysM peptidoglycan-binding domain-containing protein [Thermoflexales bacterium]|nr:LysM peptidoglycan-binding domain-containing protein [Thermoflexales bacterium]